MARKIVVMTNGNTSPALLSESLAHDEHQLQETMKANPDLLPIDEFGMIGPLLVIGRETSLPSGAIDLVAVARSGELLVVEFKTGPDNPDFRAVVAQLVDYGSDLWGMTYGQFEQTVPLQYFASPRCSVPGLMHVTSLADAGREFWKLSTEELATFQDAVSRQLRTGGFHFAAVAQRFTPAMLRTMEYLDTSMPYAHFYAVEMVRFDGENRSAFESRTIFKSKRRPIGISDPREVLDRVQFLEAIPDEGYRHAVDEFLQFCEGRDLVVYYGTAGFSVRINAGGGSALSIGWVFPPGVGGWMGLTDATFGYDPTSLRARPDLVPLLDAYLDAVARIGGAVVETRGGLKAWKFAPDRLVQSVREIEQAIGELKSSIDRSVAT